MDENGKSWGFISLPLESLRDSFLAQMKALNYSYKSINSYKHPLNRLLRFLTESNIERIQEVNLETLEKYRLSLVEAKFKYASLEMYIRVVRLFFKWLEDKGLIFINPALSLERVKKDERLAYTPTEKEMETLINESDLKTFTGIRDRAIIETSYSCGLRLNELLSLTLQSIDLKNSAVRFTGKGRKERILPLTSQAVFYLEKYLKESRSELLGQNNQAIDSLWISKYHRKLTPFAIQKMLQSYADSAKLENRISVHAIRRATATHLLNNGAHPVQIQLLASSALCSEES